jgi:signal transduction histidine kinase
VPPGKLPLKIYKNLIIRLMPGLIILRKIISLAAEYINLNRYHLMSADFVIVLSLVVSIVAVTAFAWLYFVIYRKTAEENNAMRTMINELDQTVERRVKERTKQLEEMRDSISNFAVQRFELARELEDKNHRIIEQKDLTEKQSERLREAYEEIKRLEGFRQQMVQMMIHDLKNPLNVILNVTDSEDIPVRPKNIIRQISFEMLDLIVNLLEVQKFKEMKMKVENENIDLNSLLRNLTGTITPMFVNSAIELKTSVPEHCWINADRHIVNRLLTNILSNSIKNTPSGGRVHLAASRNGEEILFEIKDNGNGIPEGLISSVFDMYGQGDNNGIQYNSSTGIGLAYCKLAVEASGGRIGIKSEYGKGTLVWFTLTAGNVSENNHNEDISGQIEIKLPEFGLTEEDLEHIRPYINKLQAINICEVTEVLSVTNKIACSENGRIAKWKESVEETLFSANEKRYKELIDII